MSGESGSVSVLWLGLVGLLGAVAVATAGLAGVYSARAQAQLASDAAALAAAVATYPPAARGDPVVLASRTAAANGAVLVHCRCGVDPEPGARVAEVVTYVDIELPLIGALEVRAASRAEFDPRLWLGR